MVVRSVLSITTARRADSSRLRRSATWPQAEGEEALLAEGDTRPAALRDEDWRDKENP